MNRTLVIAPHPDDELIGVGGTIAKRILQGSHVTVAIITKGFPPLHHQETIIKGIQEDYKANKAIGVHKLIRLGFPANKLDNIEQYKINSEIHKLILETEPNEVYIPFDGDIHIDHKIISEACMVALRPKEKFKVNRILSYEVPSETGWKAPRANNVFAPNTFEDISETYRLKKVALNQMKSQITKNTGTRSVESIMALSRYRGSIIGVKYAEAFMLEREIR